MTASDPDSPRALYERLAAEHLSRPHVSAGRSFSNETLTVGGKVFAFAKGDRLVVKLPAAQAAGLVADGAAVPFESGGRQMREWVSVAPAPDEGAWARLLDDAERYVAGLAGVRLDG
jgi:hypothetical protein